MYTLAEKMKNFRRYLAAIKEETKRKSKTKNTVSAIKNALDMINIRLAITKDVISECKNKPIDTVQKRK